MLFFNKKHQELKNGTNRKKSKQQRVVYVSEYNAPTDFECLWQKEIRTSLAVNSDNKKGIEKLFRCNT